MSDTGLTAPEVWYVAPGETVNALMSFENLLAKEQSAGLNETLTGTPVVTGPMALTITNKEITDTVRTINGRKVELAKAVSFTVEGFVVDTDYTITVTCDTTEGQTRVRYGRLLCRDE